MRTLVQIVIFAGRKSHSFYSPIPGLDELRTTVSRQREQGDPFNVMTILSFMQD